MKALFTGLVLLALSTTGVMARQSQVLVRIDDEVVTAADLTRAIGSSPFAVQTNTMSREDQAAINGLLLKKLVGAHLLRVEAKRLRLDETPAFRKEIREYEDGLLYRRYQDQLRKQAELSKAELKELFDRFKDDGDAFKAAKAARVSEKYRTLRFQKIKELQEKYHIVLHVDRIKPGLVASTVLISGDGFRIPYGDIINVDNYEAMPDVEWLKNRVYEHTEFVMMARAAREAKIDVSEDIRKYRRDRLPSLMRAHLEKKWITGEKVLRDYYASHPGLSKIPVRWHVGQIVVADEARAKSLRRQILLGKSLFVLAGQYSIDPYGRSRNGDMGWLKEGEGNPKIEKVLSTLEDGKVSPIIKTAKGYHLITVLERKKGRVRQFEEMKDRVRQEVINEKLARFFQNAQKRHKVVWKILTGKRPKTSAN